MFAGLNGMLLNTHIITGHWTCERTASLPHSLPYPWWSVHTCEWWRHKPVCVAPQHHHYTQSH